jgi:hypothetical protein
MATYDDYFKSLKHIADSETGKYVVPLKNNKDSLSAELAKLSQEYGELSAKLSKLQDENKELAAELSEQKGIVERETLKTKKKRMLIFSIVLGGLCGGFIFPYISLYLFSASSFQNWYDYALLYSLIGGPLFLIFGCIIDRGGNTCYELGCGGLIAAALLAVILKALLPTPFLISFVFGIIYGIFTGIVVHTQIYER